MAYTLPAANLLSEGREQFALGEQLFSSEWRPERTRSSDLVGLGPLFNQPSCRSCHLLDGRGSPPGDSVDANSSAVLRVSMPDGGKGRSHPIYGNQIQPRAITGFVADGIVAVHWKETAHQLADGTKYSLREPELTFHALAFGPLEDKAMVSLRVAPALIGLGLLEAVPEAALRARADPNDSDHDGISGRLNIIWDETVDTWAVGRFGWKANRASIRQQNATALLEDMGVTTPYYLTELATPAHGPADAHERREPEISSEMLELLVFYTRMLAVPMRGNVRDPLVLQGARLFEQAKCARCHVPCLGTNADAALPELSSQTICPYTDLLLHNMGEGLADGKPDGDAGPAEWRTPPLWGIGLSQRVNGHTFFLHDGRARNLLEAILWHGGEAEESRRLASSMPAARRRALIAFLESL